MNTYSERAAEKRTETERKNQAYLDKRKESLARLLEERYEQDYRNYLAECEEYAERGFRPHYCEHGTNLWVDYDNICGGCEEGITMGDAAQRRERALFEAEERLEEHDNLIRLMVQLSDERLVLTAESRDDLRRRLVSLLTP